VSKSTLKTIRFSPEETREIDRYLRLNPSFESLSSLGRVAVMEFIRTRRALNLQPLEEEAAARRRPSFLWDYDLTEAQIHEILRHAPSDQRRWLIARILERAPYREVFRYLTVAQVRQALPSLRMNPKVKRHWQEAVELWTSRRSRS